MIETPYKIDILNLKVTYILLGNYQILLFNVISVGRLIVLHLKYYCGTNSREVTFETKFTLIWGWYVTQNRVSPWIVLDHYCVFCLSIAKINQISHTIIVQEISVTPLQPWSGNWQPDWRVPRGKLPWGTPVKRLLVCHNHVPSRKCCLVNLQCNPAIQELANFGRNHHDYCVSNITHYAHN